MYKIKNIIKFVLLVYIINIFFIASFFIFFKLFNFNFSNIKDLIRHSENRNIGIVDGLFSSGDNDVLIVKNDERKDDIYIPCTKANIIKITTTYIQVRWDNEI